MKNYIIYYFLLLAIVSLDCQKFLDEKPDKALAIPQTLKDVQALLDNTSAMNNGVSNAIAEGSSDNYYLTYANWESLTSEANKSIYIWGDEVIFDAYPNEWANTYRVVYTSNLVLETLSKIQRTNENDLEWKNVKGSALFFRARSFLSLVTNWAKAYDSEKSKTDLGIPLRLSSDFNIPSVRATVSDCYEQIIKDLLEATELLPGNAAHVLRPSKPAAFALLARTYLSMGRYTEAGVATTNCLQYFNQLLDYNTVNRAANFPFSQFNKEVIFHSIVALPAHLNNTRAVIDSNLYNSYVANDIRRAAFFKSNGNGTYGFKGSYNGSVILFDGIACDEVFLTRAECFARNGNLAGALNDLNTLLRNRHDAGSYLDYLSNSQQEVINKILLERRKQLLMRNIRWLDLKRLNKEIEHQVTIRRKLNGVEYLLLPNDNKYALPLPAYVLQLTGMPQNSR